MCVCVCACVCACACVCGMCKYVISRVGQNHISIYTAYIYVPYIYSHVTILVFLQQSSEISTVNGLIRLIHHICRYTYFL